MFVFFGNHLFSLKHPNAMKHMILTFKLKGDVIADHFLMLWFQKDSLDTVSFRTYGGGAIVLNVLNVLGGEVTSLGLSPKFYHFFWLASLNRKYSFTAYCAYL